MGHEVSLIRRLLTDVIVIESWMCEGRSTSGWIASIQPNFTAVIMLKKGQRYEPKSWDIFSMAMIIYFM